ncbi:hypothetical protein ACYPKM_01775 [Pseudomonas aeruginosa]
MTNEVVEKPVKLTEKQEALILLAFSSPMFKQVSVTVQKPNISVCNALVKKGIFKNIMDTFYALTDEGLKIAAELAAKQPQ